MDPEKMDMELERVDDWQVGDDNGWAQQEVASRFEAGARGEIFTELVKAGPRLTRYPAARDLLDALSQCRVGKPTVLDFGCANGIYGDILAAAELTRDWRYIGADINPSMILACQQRYPDREFVTLEATRPLPFPAGSVDVVLASGVIEYVPDTATILREFARVCRSSVILSRIPCRPAKPAAIYRQTVRHAWGTERHCFRIFNETEFHQAMEGTGFRIIDRRISEASGEWNLPDDPEHVRHFNYLLEKRGDLMERELAQERESNAWLEQRAADLQFEVDSLRNRLQESQAMRQELQGRLAAAAEGNSAPAEYDQGFFSWLRRFR